MSTQNAPGRELDLYEGLTRLTPELASPAAAGGVGGDHSGAPPGWLEVVWRGFPRTVRERYRPQGVLGEGGMGIVIQAVDTVLEREVAVKGLRDPRGASEAGRKRASREARTSARLSHPNILPVFDIWTDVQGNPWCSMLRVPGSAPTLAGRFEELSRGGWSEARRLRELLETFQQVCRAVAYAHSRGVLHRDLKPENILLGPSGEALVADWGLACSTGAAQGVPGPTNSPANVPLELVGTRGYAAPEQLGAFGEPRSDERSDVYSLGVILLEVVGGRHPTGQETWGAAAAAGATAPEPPDVPERAPRELAGIIRRAIAWRSEHRFPSVESLNRAVEAYLEGGLVEGLSYTPWERVKKWARTHPALAGGCLAALLFTGMLVRQFRRTEAALAEARVNLTQAHQNLALSHTGWAEEARKSGRPELAELHAALALAELGRCPPGFTLPSGAPYSILAGPPPTSPLDWACTLDFPAEVVELGRDGKSLWAVTRGVGVFGFELPSGRLSVRSHVEKTEVWGVALSPDRKLVATVGGDKLVCLWDRASGRQLAKMEGNRSPLWTVAFSPDGKLLAMGGHDRTVRFWDVARGRQTACLEGPTGQIWSLGFSPDGKYVATGDTDGLARIWDVEGRRQLHILRGHTGPVLAVEFSPDSKTLASGSDDRSVRLFSVAAGTALTVLGEVPGTGQALAFSPDGTRLASGHSDYVVRLWNLTARKLERELAGHTNWISSLDFSGDGKRLASVSQDRTVRLWDVQPGRQDPAWTGHTRSVGRLAVSPDARRLATAALDGSLRLWELPSGRPLGSYPGFTREVLTVAFTPGGEPRAAVSAPGGLAWKRIDSNRPETSIRLEADRVPQFVVFSPSGEHLAVSLAGGTFELLTLSDGRRRAFERLPGETLTLAFGAAGSRLAAGGTYRDVVVLDTATGRELMRGAGHTESVEALAFDPTGRWLASGGQDFSLWLWDVATGSKRKLGVHGGHIWTVAFSPDGELLASGGLDGKIRLWRLPGGEPMGLLDPDTSGVAALAFTPDGRYLVSAGGLRPQLWDLQILRAPAAAAARVLDHSLFTQQEGTAHPVPKPAGEASEVR